jgi:nitrogen regulatory protein PII
MYVLKANIPRRLVQDLTDALIQLGVLRLRFAEISGYTDGVEAERHYRGRTVVLSMLQEVEIEALVANDGIDPAIEIMMTAIRGDPGSDGFISVAPLEQCYRVSSGHSQL